MKIILGVTGSVGAQLTQKMIDALEEKGHEVQCIGTESSREFTNIPYLQDDEFARYAQDGSVGHIELAHWGDCFLLCPCTANTLNKWRLGICDNIVLSTLKAYEGPIYVAPVMNTNMLKKEMPLIHDLEFSTWEEEENIKVLWPTVKKLACGDVGLGAYPHISDIATIVSGHRWQIPNTFTVPGIFNYRYMDESYAVERIIDHPGWFGGKRKHDIHTGVDLYCAPNTKVRAFEDGEVVEVDWFTGENAKCPWWFESKFIAIAGKSGTIIYGELEPDAMYLKGDKIKAKDIIGTTVRILKKPPKSHVIGHRMDMLHIELVETGKAKWGEDWLHEKERPKYLKDPTIYLFGSDPYRVI